MRISMKQLTKAAMMAAIVFLCTYVFKIPIAATGGYTHLGDCAVFLSVLLLGRRQGALAGAIGAAMADLIGGFAFWVVPTFLIKGLMALAMGAVSEKLLPGKRAGWLAGAAVGGALQVAGYQAVKYFLISPEAAVATIPTVTVQTVAGIVLAAAVISFLDASHVLHRLREL